MKSKKLVIIVAAIFAAFCFTGVALAANRIEVKVTSEPYPPSSTCDKAGGFSLEFDSGTQIKEGDRIIIDLPLQPDGTKMAICQGNEIDFWVLPRAATDNVANLPEWLTVDIPTSNNAAEEWEKGPIYFFEDTNAVAGNGTVFGEGVYFHIYSANTDTDPWHERIYIDVVNDNNNGIDDYIEVGPDSGDKFVIMFLGQRTDYDPTSPDSTHVDYTNTYPVPTDEPDNRTNYVDVETESPTPIADPTSEATYKDNTLCIGLIADGAPGLPANWPVSTINANMDSKNDKFTFIPSNPQIAHLASGTPAVVETCKRYNCGTIDIASTQQTPRCWFDQDTNWNGGQNFCTSAQYPGGNSIQNRIIFNARLEPEDKYFVTAEILVNGQTGENGVYFANDGIDYDLFTTLDAACQGVATTALGTTFYRANGAVTVPRAPNVACAALTSNDFAVKAVTTPALMVAGTSTLQRDVFFDLPLFHFTGVEEGDVVEVIFSFIKYPCTTLITETFCIGTFGCEAGITRTLLYPYFAEMDINESGGWWDGLAIVNLSGTDGMATVTAYEMDGDVAQIVDIPVGANSMFVNTLGAVLDDMSFVTSGGSGVLGDAKAYIVVCTDFVADGFAMIGNAASGQSMGYLPRNAPNLDALPACP